MPAVSLRHRLLHVLAAGAVWLTPSLAAPTGPTSHAAAPPGPTAGAETTAAQDSYDGLFVRGCGNNAGPVATTTSNSFSALATCTLVVGHSGHVLVMASGSVGLVNSGDSYEANFRLDHNTGLTGDSRTDRYVDAYPDGGLITPGADGTDRNVALTAIYTVTTGTHTFGLLYRRSEGSGAVEVIDPTLNVLFIPDGIDLQLCGQMSDGLWTNNTITHQASVKCSLTAPRPGLVFVSADGWMGLDSPSSPSYVAAHEIFVDHTNGGAVAVRYTDVYTNTGDGVDTTVATQVFSVTTGAHDFDFAFRREYGSGVVRMADAVLVALYVPFDSPYAQTCSGRLDPSWQNATGTTTALASCTLTAPRAGWAFMSGTAGVSLAAGTAIEAQFGLAQDNLSALNNSARYVNSYPDTLDGTQGPLADTLFKPLTAGSHSFSLVGRRYSGTGTVNAWYPVLFVLVPTTNLFLPQTSR